jgi:hypothetical protein
MHAIPVRNLKVYADSIAVEYPTYIGANNTKRGKKEYDRKNTISREGYILNRQAVRKIKSVAAYKFFTCNRNKNGTMKFFTFTVQEKAYLDKFVEENEAFADRFYIKKMGRQLENLSRRGLIRGYVWVAEKTKKGIIHFHCILQGSFLGAKALSSEWANHCGFEDYGNSVHYGFEKKQGEYKKTKIEKIEVLNDYLTKYCAKGATDQNGMKIYGRAYGMSASWSECFVQGKAFNVIEAADKSTMPELRYMWQNAKLLVEGVAYVDQMGEPKWFAVYKFPGEKMLNLLPDIAKCLHVQTSLVYA